MFLPLRTDSPLRTTPYMNWALIAINVALYVAQLIAGSRPGKPGWDLQFYLIAGKPELLDFISYAFLHDVQSPLHLAGNMLFLYIFGNNVNDKMGHIGYLAFYLASAVFAGVFYCLWDNDGAVIGASGAVSAIVGAYLILFPRANITVLVFFFFIGAYEIPSFYFVLIFFAWDLIGLSGVTNVAHSAHIGGTLFGVLVCLTMLLTNLLPRDQFDVVALVKQWNRRRQYRDAVSSGWNPYAPGRPSPARRDSGWVQNPAEPPPPPDPRQSRVLDLRAQISEAAAHHNLPEAARLYLELKAVDPTQVLARQSQLDIANQLTNDQRFYEAVEAYETFLRHYPKYEQTEQVELMLGIVLNRYLNQPARAREYLLRANAKMMDEKSGQLARAELEKIDRALAADGSPSA